jgi:tRNA nucleotidyltransferase (CCA-adding enzyme)
MRFPSRLDVPDDVMEIARTLEDAGHAAWCVGGAVRDTLLGEPNNDFDIATAATPDEVQRLFRHTVPVGERFGTIAVRTRRRLHEVTTFRRDVTTDGRHATVAFGASLEEDLARRDFTINAIAYHPLNQTWSDPCYGALDLEARLIRAVGDPEARFREDYLRILRGIRFAARFEFAVEPATWEALQRTVEGTRQLSAERVHDEWFKGLRTARNLPRLIRLWISSGASRVWVPELLGETRDSTPASSGVAPMSRLAERAGLLPAVLGDTAADVPRDPVLLTSLLCLDPVAVLIRLKASNADIARATALVTGPIEPEGHSVVSVRRWMAAVGEAAADLTLLWRFRHGASAPWEPVMQGVVARAEPLSRRQLAVSGSDLRDAGIPPGPQMGVILDRLLSVVLDDPALNTREILLARARSLL